MILRDYQADDIDALLTLFYDTVHTINRHDYTQAQCDVWAHKQMDIKQWHASLMMHKTLCAWEGDTLVGFADIDVHEGYLDRLYVHKDYQGKGIATHLCDALEQASFSSSITTYASITALPFFQKRGYVIIEKHQVIRNQITLTNYHMRKEKYKESSY